MAKLQGPVDPSVPPFVSLCYTCTHGPYNEPGPGFLGPSMAPFRMMGKGREDMLLRGLSVDRLADRKTLLKSFDTMRRDADANGAVKAMDAFTEQAFGLLTSSRMAEALDLSKEPVSVRERYGTGEPQGVHGRQRRPRVPQSLLMARRLVEAGARVVTLNYSKWDWHGGKNAEGRADNSIFLREAEDFPIFDQCVSALVEDLHQRGLDKDCTVLIVGEFGRTPKISAQVGRDHWPQVNCALLAGGGMRTGQVIGATDRIAGEAVARPVTWGELFATLYHNLGIDSHRATASGPHRPAAVPGRGRRQSAAGNNLRLDQLMRHSGCVIVFAVLLACSASADERLKGVACRSVHLAYPAPEGDAFYTEMTVEKSADGTYFMAAGWSKGYFGIQELASGKKVVLFSVWDPAAGNNAKAVDETKRVKMLYKDAAVRAGALAAKAPADSPFSITIGRLAGSTDSSLPPSWRTMGGRPIAATSLCPRPKNGRAW